jgi:hypothetical protein
MSADGLLIAGPPGQVETATNALQPGLAWGGFLESGLLWFFKKTTSSDCPLKVVFASKVVF